MALPAADWDCQIAKTAQLSSEAMQTYCVERTYLEAWSHHVDLSCCDLLKWSSQEISAAASAVHSSLELEPRHVSNSQVQVVRNFRLPDIPGLLIPERNTFQSRCECLT